MLNNLGEQVSGLKILIINVLVTSFVSVAEIEIGLKIASVSMAIVYTVWKFYVDYTDRKDRKDAERKG